MPQEYRQEDFAKKLQHLEVGDKFISMPGMITIPLLESFLSLIGIGHPLFLSDEYAQSYGFKSRVSTGLLTFTYMMGLLWKSGLLHDGIYLETNKCRHILPVYPGDMIRGEVEVLDKKLTSKGDRFIIHYKWQAKNQDDQIVSEGENTCMFPAP